ncbi:hypothetical protein FOMPIDRAFT_91490 [Fomitopsis schrenkii]|uniref:Uncharacterized protein n=1 Tax=Fomitopsis schrenkii TaxID=2126942 RepID=S8DHR8_FOMSC|nr:hypothetical protein FOMPIDRAFT_91490 [Fomitopsis schrenkii]
MPPDTARVRLEKQLQMVKKAAASKSKGKSKNRLKENSRPAAPASVSGDSANVETRRKVEVQWSAKKNADLTDALLSVIEERESIRVALGFAKGDRNSGVSTTGGGNALERHYEKIAREVFLVRYSDLGKTEANIPKLGNSVKNRIDALKKLYRTHRETLGKTGAGLISENRDSEITAGSELDNIWQKVQAEFPWYKRMDALMKNHPSIARDAVANSTTSVNTGVLDAAVRRTSNGDSVTDDESPSSDDGGSDAQSSDKEPLQPLQPVEVPQPSTPSATPSTAAAPQSAQKRKVDDLFNSVKELSELAREQRLRQVELKEAEKTKWSVKKAKMKAEAELALDRECREHAKAEAEAQQAHELQMMEMQLRIAQVNRGVAEPPAELPLPSAIDPALQ